MFNNGESDLPDRLTIHKEVMAKLGEDMAKGAFDGMQDLERLFDGHTPVGLDKYRNVVAPPSYDFHDGPAVLVLDNNDPNAICTGPLIDATRVRLSETTGVDYYTESLFTTLRIPSNLPAFVCSYTFAAHEQFAVKTSGTAPVLMVLRSQEVDTSIMGHEADHWSFYTRLDTENGSVDQPLNQIVQLANAEKRAYPKAYAILNNLGLAASLPAPLDIAEQLPEDPVILSAVGIQSQILNSIKPESGLEKHVVTLSAMAIIAKYGEQGSASVTENEYLAFRAFGLMA